MIVAPVSAFTRDLRDLRCDALGLAEAAKMTTRFDCVPRDASTRWPGADHGTTAVLYLHHCAQHTKLTKACQSKQTLA